MDSDTHMYVIRDTAGVTFVRDAVFPMLLAAAAGLGAPYAHKWGSWLFLRFQEFFPQNC